MDMHIAQSYFVDCLGIGWNKDLLAPYLAWVDKLPRELATCCRDLIGDEIANSNLVNLPLLVGESFGVEDKATLTELVSGNACMLTLFLASDRLLDAPARADKFTILAGMKLQLEMLHRYDSVAPGQATAIWERLMENHVWAVLQEELHHTRVRNGMPGLDLGAYETVVIRKNRYGMAAIPILAAATGKHAIGERLSSVFDRMAIEIEFDDDLKDWAEDLQEGRFTPVVQALVQAANSRELPAIRRALIESDVIDAMLEEIERVLAEAWTLLSEADFPCDKLKGWIERHRQANRRLRTDVIQRQVYAALIRATR